MSDVSGSARVTFDTFGSYYCGNIKIRPSEDDAIVLQQNPVNSGRLTTKPEPASVFRRHS